MHNPGDRKLAPVLLAATPGDPVTRIETFGPVLPVITWRTPADLNDLIPRTPLALYIFTADTAFAQQLITRHPSDSACINDCIIQIANGNAPFGGVGTSGMGCYHARYSIDTFSRKRTIITRKNTPNPALRYPRIPKPPWKKSGNTGADSSEKSTFFRRNPSLLSPSIYLFKYTSNLGM